ncbi:MAG: undecaprenyl-phosphate glucose phosphotransferase [Bdellovibrionaceae bacterium]|nr:undecaprenyl-phosphate glucose phosphotransferase [Pseudobdellovibrionaceae bacterium]
MNKNIFYNNKSFDFTFLLNLLDIISLVLSAYVCFDFLFNLNIFMQKDYQGLLFTAVILQYIVFNLYGLYKSWRGVSSIIQFRDIFSAWAIVFLSLVLLGAILKITAVYSRLWMGSWALTCLLSLLAFRQVFKSLMKFLRKRGWNRKNVIIIGAGDLGENVCDRLNSSEWTGFNVLAFIDDNKAMAGKCIEGIPVLVGTNLCEFIEKNKIHEVWITLPLKAEDRINEILFELRNSTANVRFVPNIFSFKLLLNQSITDIVGIATINLSDSPLVGFNLLIKEIEDRVLSLFILIIISPILLIIAIAIKIESRGPALFKQKRLGFDGKPINVYKFRSMYIHKEKENEITQATKNDCRVTRVGAFLRRLSLDELPQFYNVLQGRMSIVGPRPHALAHNEFYRHQVEYYALRHKVKPGITGWAQVNGWRGETDTLIKMEKRVEHDLYYIQNWTLWFDIKIIFLTLIKGFIHEKAY